MPHAKLWAVVAGLVMTAGVTAAATYALRDSDAVSTARDPPATPDSQVTPAPNSTPVTSGAGWYIPYVNADRDKPKFKGSLNGIDIDADAPGRTGYDLCPGVGLNPVAPSTLLYTVVSPGPLRIDPRLLPGGVTPSNEPPDAFACGGNLAEVVWKFQATPQVPGVNPGGTTLFIRRVIGKETIQHSAPQDRWTGAQIRGVNAVVLRPIVEADGKQFGECLAALYDSTTNVTTVIEAAAANAQFCKAVAEAVTS